MKSETNKLDILYALKHMSSKDIIGQNYKSFEFADLRILAPRATVFSTV
jgi:hypothetical protein